MLDISAAALQKAKARLGTRAGAVTWIEADITQTALPARSFDLWHDRAVFHFLITSEDREGYKRNLNATLKPGGYAILATFALDGPPKCSGLDVMRYSPDTLAMKLGYGFTLMSSAQESHRTPFGTTQSFTYCLFQKTT